MGLDASQVVGRYAKASQCRVVGEVEDFVFGENVAGLAEGGYGQQPILPGLDLHHRRAEGLQEVPAHGVDSLAHHTELVGRVLVANRIPRGKILLGNNSTVEVFGRDAGILIGHPGGPSGELAVGHSGRGPERTAQPCAEDLHTHWLTPFAVA